MGGIEDMVLEGGHVDAIDERHVDSVEVGRDWTEREADKDRSKLERDESLDVLCHLAAAICLCQDVEVYPSCSLSLSGGSRGDVVWSDGVW